MKQNRPRTNENGQPNGLARANSAKTNLASQLASLTGVEALARLTETEASALLEFLDVLGNNSESRGYTDGWDAAMAFTNDMTYLRGLAPGVEH